MPQPARHSHRPALPLNFAQQQREPPCNERLCFNECRFHEKLPTLACGAEQPAPCITFCLRSYLPVCLPLHSGRTPAHFWGRPCLETLPQCPLLPTPPMPPFANCYAQCQPFKTFGHRPSPAARSSRCPPERGCHAHPLLICFLPFLYSCPFSLSPLELF